MTVDETAMMKKTVKKDQAKRSAKLLRRLAGAGGQMEHDQMKCAFFCTSTYLYILVCTCTSRTRTQMKMLREIPDDSIDSDVPSRAFTG